MLRVTPFTVGEYRCDQHLGTSGSGATYAAVHLPTGARRAIKILSSDVLNDADVADPLLQAVRASRSLNHPNILRVHDFIEHRGDLCVVRALVNGLSLRQAIGRLRGRSRFPLSVSARIMWQLSEALNHAIDATTERLTSPLVHGGMWPENVLISWRGEVYLSDFGLWMPSLRGGAAMGPSRQRYASPEQRQRQALTQRSDVFAAGVLLYELVTGQELIVAAAAPGDTGDGMISAEQLERVPPSLRSVVRRCLLRDPSQRYADAAALSAALLFTAPDLTSPEVEAQLVALVCRLGGRAPDSEPTITSSDVHHRGSVEQDEVAAPVSCARDVAPAAVDDDDPTMAVVPPFDEGSTLSGTNAIDPAVTHDSLRLVTADVPPTQAPPPGEAHPEFEQQPITVDLRPRGGRTVAPIVPPPERRADATRRAPSDVDGQVAAPEVSNAHLAVHRRPTSRLRRGLGDFTSMWITAHALFAFSVVVFSLAMGLVVSRHFHLTCGSQLSTPPVVPAVVRTAVRTDGGIAIVEAFAADTHALTDAGAPARDGDE